MAVTNGWGQAAKNNTNGFGKLATNNIGAGSIYENSYSGDTALIGTSAAFLYSKSSFNQGEADPTPTITGTAGGSFNADAGVVFVDTGSFNSSTGQIDLSATSIGSHIITYTVNGVQSGQTVGISAPPYSNVYSFEFDSFDAYIPIGSPIGGTGAATISMWLNTDTVSSQNRILSNSDSGNYAFSVLFGGGTIQVGGGSTGNVTVVSSVAVDNQWFHLCLVFDGSGNVTGYKNGVPGSAVATASNRGNLGLGATLGLRFGTYYNGTMDEAAFWDTALSGPAVTEIWNSGTPNNLNSLTNASGPVAWYRMGEQATFSGGNWTLTDQGSGGNDATSVNLEESDRKTDTP